MEPLQQVEIQLGHMCNNRCVFCVSGQQTAEGKAGPLDVAPVIHEIEKAFASGHRKLTLLGGEPTLQPGFLDVVRRAVALGYEEIVLFTNGAKTAREGYIDEILATGGRFTWRISMQGATTEAHERTTLKEGSFGRIQRTMATLAKKGETVTVNMCVVQSNYDSVAAFPALLLPLGVKQLHLDMIRPSDAGVRTEEELRAMVPRYTDLVPAMEAMIEGFPDDFDVNIGNLPYCLAPKLARWIHHDGERTLTIAVDGQNKLSQPWDKYLTKRRDKMKPASCKACVFESRCSGVFEAYRHFYGTDELVPITAEALAAIDGDKRFLALHLRPFLARLGTEVPALGHGYAALTAVETGDAEVTLTLAGPGVEPLRVALRHPGEGAAGFDQCSLQIVSAPNDRALALGALRALCSALVKSGLRPVHPLGADAVTPVARSVGARLARLRAAAPFGELAWDTVTVTDAGKRAEASFSGPAGERATVWLAEQAGRATGGYRVDAGSPTPALVEGLRAVMAALRPRVDAMGSAATPSSTAS
jgi:MoaA/NifB/PqqE/SkfB family radical SAM enzyme